MAADDPTPGELGRKIDTLGGQIADLVGQLRDFQQRQEETYLRRETYMVQQQADARVLAGLRTDLDAIVEQQRQNRRLALSGIVLPVLATVLAALILVAVLP